MKKVLSVMLAVSLFLAMPVLCVADSGGSFLDRSFFEMRYSVPESWKETEYKANTVTYIPFESEVNGAIAFSEQDIDLSIGDRLDWMVFLTSVINDEDAAEIDDVSALEVILVDELYGLRMSYTGDWYNGRAVGWLYVFATDTKGYAITWVVTPEKAEELQETMEEIISGITFSDDISAKEEKIIEPGIFDEETVISQLETREMHYNDIWDYDFLIVKNNSEFDLDLTVNVLYYDENDQIIGVTSREEKAVESGYPVVFWFMPDDKYARVEYTFSVEEEDWYEPVLSDLSYEENATDRKVILSVTNNGDEPADFVEGIVIFFNDEDPVGFDHAYFTDDDSELKPGKTIIKEFNCYDSFDSYEVYFTGRR